jgi:hypothetical protein
MSHNRQVRGNLEHVAPCGGGGVGDPASLEEGRGVSDGGPAPPHSCGDLRNTPPLRHGPRARRRAPHLPR